MVKANKMLAPKHKTAAAALRCFEYSELVTCVELEASDTLENGGMMRITPFALSAVRKFGIFRPNSREETHFAFAARRFIYSKTITLNFSMAMSEKDERQMAMGCCSEHIDLPGKLLTSGLLIKLGIRCVMKHDSVRFE